MNPRDVAQALLLGVGILAVGFAGIMAISKELAGAVPFGHGVLGGVGVVMTLVGLSLARAGWRARHRIDPLPAPEHPLEVPTPGDEVDEMLVQLLIERHGGLEYRERIHERLVEAAIAVIRYQHDCTREEALARVESGTWTDDEVAQGFLSGDTVADSRSLLNRFLGRAGSDPYNELVRRTVVALLDVSELRADEARAEETRGRLSHRVLAWIGVIDPTEDDTPHQSPRYPDWVAAATDAPVDAFVEIDVVPTRQWHGISALALVVAGVGIFLNHPGLLLAGGATIVFAGYARSMDPPSPDQLRVTREVSDPTPDPGEVIEVTVTVTNTGRSLYPDVRVIDVIPESFVVTDGTLRHATALRPKGSARFSYTVVVERGRHEWPVSVSTLDHSGSTARRSLVTPESDVECFPSLVTPIDMPVRSQTSQYTGEVSTEIGGAGLEFFAVREYRDGDPMKRIDWSRLAKSGELATIELREEKAATVVLLFDTREASYLAPEPGAVHSVDRSIDAAGEVFAALFDQGDLVGLAAFDTVPLWLSPGAGTEQFERARRLFATHPAMSPVPPSQKARETQKGYVDPMTHVRRQLPQNAQIILFTPLCDNYSAEVARRLDSAGHRVTIISPDPTADRTIGQSLARVERAMRVNLLRERGLRVIDWADGDSLGLELQRARAKWAA